MKKTTINTPKAPAAIGPYEQAVRVGPWLYTSGQIPLDPASGVLLSGEIEEATERAILNLKEILEAGGASLDKAAKTTVFLTDMKLFPRMNAVYEKYFGASKPARSCVEVSSLPKGAIVEIEATAVVEDPSDVVVTFVTVPSGEEAEKLAKGIVESKLAACVNIIPSLRSIYFWEGKVCDDKELLLIIKTKRTAFEKLSEWVRKNHSYKVPEVVALPVYAGSAQYLDWVRENCG
ncbi:MAG: divalent cation tolerance protein CutA [Nitrospinae bacterium]|nr:divalent cation tolerance protein CutA [Nitrospinota bacterium]